MNFYFALSQGYEHKLYVRYLIYFVIALQIRLGNSTNNKTGRVEIFHPFIGWGTVCNNGWDDTDSGVVCRQLGFSGANATSKAYYEGGTGLILLDEVHWQGIIHMGLQSPWISYTPMSSFSRRRDQLLLIFQLYKDKNWPAKFKLVNFRVFV
jgi:phosphatidylserine/phosphatidylglycerophosphate/cardiolipin synthase-like enzyme